MSKRNISYIKPQDPSFLRKLKEQIGYKEGPTVDTKKEALAPVSDEEDLHDEQPTVVVLQPGDLTAEEAVQEQRKLEKEITEAPADLNSRIIFNKPVKQKSGENSQGKKRETSEKLDKSKNSKKSKSDKTKPLLSFDDEEEEDF